MRSRVEWLEISDPGWLRFGRRGSAAFLAIGCVLIGAWQLHYVSHPERIDTSYEKSPGIRGIYEEKFQGFFYFFYYTGKFPISMSVDSRFFVPDPNVARRYLSTRNPQLMNEDYAAIRTGDLGKIFLLYPDMLRVASPREATLLTFNRILGVGSLLCLFVSLSLLNHRMLAVLLVTLFGSNPYQLYHLYVPPSNVWAYPICVGSLMLALNATVILGNRVRRPAFVLPLVSGVFLASILQARTEPALIGAGLAVVYAIARTSLRGRIALLTLFLAGFGATTMAWDRYWDDKLEEAARIVREVGGKPAPDLRNLHHALWHPIWWGLGDFGRELGYKSSDRGAYAWAIPRVNERYGTDYRRSKRSFVLKNKHPEAPSYGIKPETLPEYSAVLRDKILGDITNDPLWYASVIAKRLRRVFDRATPIRLGVGSHFFDIPFSAWLFLPVLGIAVGVRRWNQVALLLLYTPTSLPTVLITSRAGFGHIAAFHVVTFAVLCCWTAHGAATLIGERLLAAAPKARERLPT